MVVKFEIFWDQKKKKKTVMEFLVENIQSNVARTTITINMFHGPTFKSVVAGTWDWWDWC